MNAHEMVSALLAGEGGRAALFPPLDDEGRSVLLADARTAITLEAPPDADDGDLDFWLTAPLLSLEGADDRTQLAFLWDLAEASAPGALPAGHSLFADQDDLSVSLGGRFSASGLAPAALETATDAFYRLVQALRGELGGRLESLAAASAAAGPAAEAAAQAAPLPGPETFLRV